MKNSTIEILNIGPLKTVKLNLNKINVFMGEQSSGKSTIAKIISFCNWVEKDVALHQSFDNYNNDKNYFINKLETFHKMKGYFSEKSEIKYESDTFKLHYQWNNFNISWNKRFEYKRSKISYIPSERSIAVLPEMEKVELSNNYLKSFLFDWFDARKPYEKDKNLPLLDIGAKYYYSSDNKESHIQNNDKNYDILLSNASSGLQSITPLVVMIDYLTNSFYKNEQSLSYEIDKAKAKVTEMLVLEFLIKPIYNIDEIDSDQRNRFITEINERLSKNDEEVLSHLKNYSKIRTNLFKTHSTNLIIEEPEQNLFPSTQKALIYYLFKNINNERNHHLTLTTHSPYVLYAINNCIMADLVSEKLNDKEKQKLNCLNSKINPKSISIYQIQNGTLNKIQGEDGLIGSNFFDNQMKEVMDEFYLMLNHY